VNKCFAIVVDSNSRLSQLHPLLQGFWCVVTVAAAAIIAATEAREKKVRASRNMLGKCDLSGFLGILTACCSTG
jgi:hypothetical protein